MDAEPKRLPDCCGCEALVVEEATLPNNPEGLGVLEAFPKRLKPAAGCVVEVEVNRLPGAGGWLLLDPNKLADDVLIDRPPGPLADLESAMVLSGMEC